MAGTHVVLDDTAKRFLQRIALIRGGDAGKPAI
jgi:hypothetical protein